MSYSLKIDGVTYYFADLATKDSINSASGDKQKELLNEALKEGAAAENESSLQEYEDDGYEDYTYGRPTTSNYKVEANPNETMTAEEQTKAYEAYCKEIGLDKLNEDSGIDDIIKVYEKIADTQKELEGEIKRLDYSDPEAVEAKINKLICAINSNATLMKTMGMKPNVDHTTAIVSGVAGVAFIGLGIKAAAAGSAAAAAGTLAAGSGASASTGVGIPVAIVLGIAAIGVGIWAWISGNEEQKKIDNLKENLEKTQEKLNKQIKTIEDEYSKELKTKVEEAEKELGNLISDNIEFEDLTDTNSINANLDKIIECQEKFEPHYNLCQKYGFEPEGFSDFMKIMGTGNQRLYRAQSYLDKYAAKAKTELGGNIGENTEKLNSFYEDIEALMGNVENKGLNTASLERILKNIKIENEKEAYTISDEIANGQSSSHNLNLQPYTLSSSGTDGNSTQSITDKIKGYLNNADVASEASDDVVSNSTAYQTSVDKIDDTKDSLEESAQANTDSYGENVSNTGSNIEEIYKVIENANKVLDELKEVSDRIDTTKITDSIEAKKEEKQALADDKAKEIEESVSASTSGAEIKAALENLNKTKEEYGQYDIDTSSFEKAYNNILKKQQDYINKMAQTYEAQASQTTVGYEVNQILNSINNTKNDNQGIDVDLSKLDTVAQRAVQKQDNYIAQTAQIYEQQANTITKAEEGLPIITGITAEIMANTGFNTSKLQTLLVALQEKILKMQQEELEKSLNQQENNTLNKDEEIFITTKEENGTDKLNSEENTDTVFSTNNDETTNEDEISTPTENKEETSSENLTDKNSSKSANALYDKTTSPFSLTFDQDKEEESKAQQEENIQTEKQETTTKVNEDKPIELEKEIEEEV